jgi:L-gulonolactone oxidase
MPGPFSRGDSWQNWARTHRSTPREWLRPGSEADVVRAVQRARRERRTLKVVGASHSWSDIARGDDLVMTLDGMRGLVDFDRATNRVTVLGGTRLRDLNARLPAYGLAMPILGSIAEQSIAGAIATATHGSSLQHGNLSTLVRGMRLVTGRGDVLDLGEADPRLPAARVGLGALGVVTQVTLQCVPPFRLEERMRSIPEREAHASCADLARRSEFGKLWWLPGTGFAQWFAIDCTGEPGDVSELARWVDERVVNGLVFEGMLGLGGRFPGLIPRLNRVIGRAYFKPRRTVGRSDRILNIAMPPVHRETEYAIPVERTGEALSALAAMIERDRLRVNFVVEARFVRGDDAWLSPAHGRDSCQIGAYMADTDDLDAYFDGFERLMATFGGRPHWGKEFRRDAAQLRPLYPEWRRFVALRRELDPDGVFVNAFVARVLGA